METDRPDGPGPAWTDQPQPVGPTTPDGETDAITTTGWIQPGDKPWPSQRARRLLSILVWLGAVLLLGLAGWIAASGLEAASSPWRIGYAAGTIGGALALTTVIRWIWLRLRQRQSNGAPLISTWIPVVSALFAIGIMGSAFSQAAAIPDPVDPSTMFNVGRGYALVAAEPGLEAELRAEFDSQVVRPRDIAVINIEADDGAVGMLVVMDVGSAEAMSELTLQGMMIGAGSELHPRRVVIGDRPTMFAATGGITMVGWVDAPLVAFLYAIDDATATDMVESVMTANDLLR